MKIYVSGSWKARNRLRVRAEKLRAMGHQVLSSWLDEQDKPPHLTQAQWLRRVAERDTAEVVACDAIIMDVDDVSTTGGRYVEWGIACNPHATTLRVLVGIPPALDVFGKLADAWFPDWAALLDSNILNPERLCVPSH
jgi:hypothetical protein